MYYTYITAKCSKCEKALFFKFLKIYWFIRVTSGLGPNYIICSSCNTRMRTATKEWQQMSFTEKSWYLILSIVYGVILGFMSSLPIGIALDAIFAYSIPTNLTTSLIVAPIVLVIFAIQVARILQSLDRTESKHETEKIVGF